MHHDRGDRGATGDAPPGAEGNPARPGAPVPGARAGRGGARREVDSGDSDHDQVQPVGGPPPQLVRGMGEARHGAAAVPECAKENLPPCADHEVEIIIRDALNYTSGQTVRSASKTVGNFRFRILVFPSGTQSTGGHQVSAFVEADPFPDLDPRWVFHAVKYQVAVVNWNDYRRSVIKCDTWTFSKDGIDRGWHDMVRTTDLPADSGWLGPDNSLCVRAQCLVRQADGLNINSDYNTKKETGYIGLKNHGATCYMNGLLQSLFHVGQFRRIVYSIDCDDNPDAPGKEDPAHEGPMSKSAGIGHPPPVDDGEGKAPPLIQALQNVFYKLQTADQAVDCRELMKSFGWDTMDAFTQHDAQELNRILCDRVEEQMKGTSMDGSIKRLFEGEFENYIECIDVDYKSRRNETFYDIQLNIKGERGQELRNIEESLREFTAEETLEGDNAYEAEGHGKQRAKKGIRFLTFPPVLNLQLKRFHFDLEKMDMVKLNTRFEFHKRLDLSDFAPNAGVYLLYAVVVHSGDVNSGHYYAHIRPDLEGGWLKFDDDSVTPCSEFAAVDDNYAGSDLSIWNYFERTPRDLRGVQVPTRPRIHNAYMLVYIREDQAAQILTPPDPRTTNPKMVDRCEREVRVAEQRKREKLEQQLKIKIKLVFERDLCRMTGFWDHAEIPHQQSLKMGRDQYVRDLTAEVESIVEVPRAHIALFSLQYRNNPRQVRFSFLPLASTFRAHIPQFNAPHFDTSDPHLVVLCVAADAYDVRSLKLTPEPRKAPEELARWVDDQVILLVVKYFCPTTRKMVTLGCFYMQQTDSLLTMVTSGWVTSRLQPFLASKEVAPLAQELVESHSDGTAAAAAWECWEEFSERDIQQRSVKRTVKSEQLWTGDVIVWQIAGPSSRAASGEGEAPSSPAGGADASADGGVDIDGEVAPMYPVHNVADLAAHIANTADVVVTLHDGRQPLCVDGVVSNGHWGPPRPASAAPSPTGAAKKAEGGAVAPPSPAGTNPTREERPEDQALAMSPAEFNPPQERELKMDLRWHLHHVTNTIARAFGLRTPANESQIWLFHAAPGSSCEEPLNDRNPQGEQTTTLKELHRTCSYLASAQGGRRPAPLTLHAVELPFPPGREVFNQGLSPLCVRFFDAAVREVGSRIITVPNNGTVQDIINESQQHLQPQWGISGPLRVLEVSEGRLHRHYRPDAQVLSLACFNRSNIFYNCLRVEADPDSNLPEGHTLLEIYHCDRQSQQAFAQPILLAVAPGEKSGSIKNRCKMKLQVPDAEFKSWRLVRCARTNRTHLKDDEAWDSETASDAKLYLEHVHPNPTSSSRQSRYNKPLTIKA
mmetsp:Transcript_129327/g.322393  ORF Transcript_129327/g.322393 Transcript_129327/m.322393 type:complete len:1329 (-) Transcript_129327:246-4232(-)